MPSSTARDDRGDRARRVVVVAFPDAEILDVTGPVSAFTVATSVLRDRGRPGYSVEVASLEGGPVRSSSGLEIMTSRLDRQHRAIDTLVVAGGAPGDPPEPQAMVDWIVTHRQDARRVCSVCTGAFLLAAAGLLDGRRATTHWISVPILKRRHPGVDVQPDPIFVRDGDVWTSAGVTAGIDLVLALIEEDCGHLVAMEVARCLVMFLKRPGGQAQFSAPLEAQIASDSRFDTLHAWIASDLTRDFRIERLAAQAGMSPRTFARTYTAKVGRTPAKTVEAIRVEAASSLLEGSDAPLKAIAVTVGFGDEQNLRRAFLRQYGIGPAEYRERFPARRLAADEPGTADGATWPQAF
ncbi:GlxA family transcriptional regulator [Marinivivus vitaminiproducens]|uniref:GlxA family transcriptional regulator n=1 Tax=Marinivivus vitaminiproducens TaxID=3035935 RepID=UPI00279A595B|nr:DJ-1/PfpI family protein [Geminicoccaceae bacterium SCSIO 64248]